MTQGDLTTQDSARDFTTDDPYCDSSTQDSARDITTQVHAYDFSTTSIDDIPSHYFHDILLLTNLVFEN